MNAMAANDRSRVDAANASLDDALSSLGEVVAREHWPAWLSDLKGNTHNYRTNHSNGKATWIAHLKSLMNNWRSIENHVWFAETDESKLFDVDLLIDAARSEFKIEELFERLILTLRNLAECPDLDSVKAVSDLEEIIKILKSAKSGSLSNQLTTWKFARTFIPNLITEYVRSSKISGPFIKAFEKTADELDIGLEHVKEQVKQGMLNGAKSGLKSNAIKVIELEHKSAN